MLLNLDLFRPGAREANGGAPGQAPNDSMLDQIRTLRAMGYLEPVHGNPSSPAAPEANRAGAATPAPQLPGPEDKP